MNQLQACWNHQVDTGPGAGITKAPFVNFSVGIFRIYKSLFRFFESRSYLTSVDAAKLRRHLTDMSVIFQKVTNVLIIPKIWENNGTEEIGLITRIPGLAHNEPQGPRCPMPHDRPPP